MVYGAFVNMAGLGSTRPLPLRFDDEGNEYWVASGPLKDNMNFPAKLGLTVRQGIVKFTSENEKEVEAFINGVRALATVRITVPVLLRKD